MPIIGAAIICAKHEEFIDLTLESLSWCDEIVIVGDMDSETLDKIDSSISRDKIKILYRKWDGNYGSAREMAVRNLNTDFILQIDADEILSDNSYLLKEWAKKGIDVLDLRYQHFIWHFGFLDATVKDHIGLNRFFRNEKVSYTKELHELAHSPKWKRKAQEMDVVLWHLGYVKGMTPIFKKFHMNINRKDRMHEVEFLKQWFGWHVFGSYPVKKVTEEDVKSFPSILKRFLGVIE